MARSTDPSGYVKRLTDVLHPIVLQLADLSILVVARGTVPSPGLGSGSGSRRM